MPNKGWRSKGDNGIRRSPRQTGKTCGRPFSAPRKARETTAKTTKIADPKYINDSEVRILTDSEIQILASMGAAIPGFDDSDEAQADNRLEDESHQDKTEQDRQAQDRIDETAQVTAESDTTESTPDIFKSPVGQVVQISQRALEKEIALEVEVTVQRQGFKYVGPPLISETEAQVTSSDSDDNVPVATLLRKEKGTTLSQQQIQDCQEGPKGEKAIGVTVSKTFEGVEFRGIVDRFRNVRQRMYYGYPGGVLCTQYRSTGHSTHFFFCAN